MKLYDCSTAPSPRRVRMFLAEKGVEIPRVEVDLRAGEQYSPEFQAVNPRCAVPVLELDDGSRLTEVLAICRYLELEYPEPALFGREPAEQARVLMWNAICEQDGVFAVAESLRNHAKGFQGRALTGPEQYQQIPELAERGKRRARGFLRMLDRRLDESPHVAGATFSLADITAFVAVEFAAWIKLTVPDDHASLQRWRAGVAARTSAAA